VTTKKTCEIGHTTRFSLLKRSCRKGFSLSYSAEVLFSRRWSRLRTLSEKIATLSERLVHLIEAV
jgi:hypothetical protein